MRALTVGLLFLPSASALAEGIEEIRVANLNETITLPANGAATCSANFGAFAAVARWLALADSFRR